jgi:hypothetical protein
MDNMQHSQPSTRSGDRKPRRDGLDIDKLGRECETHLRLMECFHKLREDVRALEGTSPTNDGGVPTRYWEDFVMLGVSRYDIWFKTMARRAALSSEPQHTEILTKLHPPIGGSSQQYVACVLTSPTDVLMVWHSHMLNPRKYYEDCVRHNNLELWQQGLCWPEIVSILAHARCEYDF